MKINAAWHKQHPMPKHPTLRERLAWHRAHQKWCACRPIPARLLAAVRQRQREQGRALSD